MIYLAFFAVPVVLVSVLLLVLVTDPGLRWRKQSRKPAEQRGIALLRSWLTSEQAKQWDSKEEFDVIGCHTGRRYRIKCGSTMNIHQLDSAGRAVTEWCFAPEGKLVTGDVLLAQKIALETMERQVLSLANTQRSRP
jgi:hypothetical protein